MDLKQVVVYNLLVVMLDKMSLWANNKPLRIAYRSLFSNDRFLWTKSKLLCTIYKSLYLNNMSLWATDRYILQINMLNDKLLWTKRKLL